MAQIEYNATVAQRVEIAPGLMILRVVPDQLPLNFEAGQYTVLGMKQSAPRAPGSEPEVRSGSALGVGDLAEGELSSSSLTSSSLTSSSLADGGDPAREDPDKMIRRAYSIASSSKADEYIEFYLAMVPSGELTPRLFSLKVHDRLYVGPKATGLFTLKKVPAHAHMYLVGTGTGLAPYMSMLRSEVECGGPQRLVILHGARYSYDLAYRTELMTITRICPNISYFPVVSRAQGDPTWRGLTGYLQDVLLSGIIEDKTGVPLDPEKSHVFLCGNPSMIESAKARLMAERGYVPDARKVVGSLHLEEYW